MVRNPSPIPPPPPALSQGEWIVAFALELGTLRKDYGAKHAARVATIEWASRRNVAPEAAARQWAAEQDARRRKP